MPARAFAAGGPPGHGPDGNTLKAGLRLDLEDGAKRKKLESGGRAIVAGNVNRSKVVTRILSSDPEHVMPPPESNLALTEYEKAVIVKWIEQGAKWKPHWAFLPVEKVEVPEGARRCGDGARGSGTGVLPGHGWTGYF